MIKFNLPELQKIYEISPAFIKTRAELLEKIDSDILLLQQVLRDEKITVEKEYWCKGEDYYLQWKQGPDYQEWYIWNSRAHAYCYPKTKLIDAHPLVKIALYPFLPHLYRTVLAMSNHE